MSQTTVDDEPTDQAQFIVEKQQSRTPVANSKKMTHKTVLGTP